MRILHVINNGSICGGAERLTADLVEQQRADGHQVHVLAGDRTGNGDWFADSTWPVRSARGPARIRNFYVNTGARTALRDALVRHAPDLVHLHTVGLLSAGALPLLRGRPTVMTVHGPEFFVRGTVRFCLPARYFRGHDQTNGRLGPRGLAAYAWAELVTAPVTRRLLRRHVEVFIAPSPYLATPVERSLGTTRVIRNGLHAGFGAPATGAPATGAPTTGAPAIGGSPDPERTGPRLALVGRLERTKGGHVLLAAMPAILAAHPTARLTVVGSGAMDEQLRRQAANLGVSPAVTFAGWCSPAETAATLAAADVAVVPSIWPEAFGLTALEALAAGCAVVASDRGGLPDLIRDGETGLLVPPDDPVALAGAVIRLLSDHELRSVLAAAGVQLAAGLTMPGYAAQVFATYRQVLAAAGRPERSAATGAPNDAPTGSGAPCR